jgi:hypothetical protein
MTPQESQLVTELFDRLAKLETTPRDPEAERLIADGIRRAPHAVYALVQTTLLQDEALKRANARIEELQAQIDEPPQPEQRQGSFLDSMRTAFGGSEPRGSVPSVRAQSVPPPPPGYPSQGYQSQPLYPPPPGYPGGPAFGTGGSFLGAAASTAAGVIGGSLLLDGIRSMFGHHLGGNQASAFGNVAGQPASPWAGNTSGGAADSQLARDAGINHIGDRAKDPIANAGNDQSTSADDALDDDTADNDDDFDDDDFAEDETSSDDSSDV